MPKGKSKFPAKNVKHQDSYHQGNKGNFNPSGNQSIPKNGYGMTLFQHAAKKENPKNGYGMPPFQHAAKKENHQNSFRVPIYVTSNGNQQAESYCSMAQGQLNPQTLTSASGNKQAAAVSQPLTRGGSSNPIWGQQMNQIQLINQIVMQCLKNNQ